MAWMIVALLLVLLSCIPFGISVIYSASGWHINLLLGIFQIPVYPSNKKKKGAKRKSNTTVTAKDKSLTDQDKTGGNYNDFLPLLRPVADFLGELWYKFRVKRLEMFLTMAGEDPCDLAINYGKAWATVGNIIPILERFAVIKRRDIQVYCDFTVAKTTIYFRADITITLCRLIGLLGRYGWRTCKEYFKIMDKRKGGAM